MQTPILAQQAPPAAAIQVRNLGKCYHIYNSPQDRLRQALFRPRQPRYAEFWALKDVSLTIPKGQTLGVVGRNGSGKSTLLQLLARTVTPTAGSLETTGRIAAILELGAGFHPEFTGRENVFLNAQMLGLTRGEIAERFDAIAAFSEIAAFIDQPVKTYSSGMYVRLAFSVVAHVSADILIIDEALAVGDIFFVQKCMRFLRDFQKDGGTIVLVSHDAAALTTLCDRVIWLEKGTVRDEGPPKQVLQNYLAAAHGFSNIAPGLPGETPRAKGDEADSKSPDYGANGAIVLSVELRAANHAPLTTIRGNEPVTLAITAKANRRIAPIILGFFVKDRLGQNLFGENTHHTYAAAPIIANPGETITAKFNFIMPTLPAGDYTITVALAEGTQSDHELPHWVHDACSFHSVTRNDALGLVGIPMTSIELTAGKKPMVEIPDIALTVPRLISGYSAWVGHIPFAFALTEMLRPSTVVELGTHNGDSYCVFCQAIEMLKLDAKATAVDTWAGDKTAGRYDSAVLDNLRAHHDPLYAGFSRLCQSTFDAAVKMFPKRTIDLLHIDGSHDYTSVRRDFETYLPLMSNAGVVLFHDTQVQSDDFGVRQLWAELAPRYPHFEFTHAYGLGILAVGDYVPKPLQQFLESANRSPEETRSAYAALGQRLELARALANLAQQLQHQLAIANRWRTKLNIPSLPDFTFPTSAGEILTASPDPKAFLDRIAWYATSLSGDFAHATAPAKIP